MIGRLLAIAFVVVTGSARAHADGAVEDSFDVRYAAPADCPEREAVIGLISERASARSRGAFEIVVTTSSDGAYHGMLVADGMVAKRVSAPRCDDVVAALALVTAVMMDSGEVSAPAPAPAPTRSSNRIAFRSTPDPGSHRAVDATLGIALDRGVAPDALVVGVLEGRASSGSLALDVALLGGRMTSAQGEASARFSWAIARPAGCVLARRGVDFAACGHFEIGAMHTAGDQIVNARDTTRLWLAAGGHATARLALSPGSRGFAQLQLGLSFPVVRDRYRFMPTTVIHETPTTTGWFGVGLGMRFW